MLPVLQKVKFLTDMSETPSHCEFYDIYNLRFIYLFAK